MFLIYRCDKCGSERYFTSKRTSDVFCEKCRDSKLTLVRDHVSVEIDTTPESRYLGDEAIFNTVGRRVSAKRNRHYAGK